MKKLFFLLAIFTLLIAKETRKCYDKDLAKAGNCNKKGDSCNTIGICYRSKEEN